MSFTDGKPHIVTPKDLTRAWNGVKDAKDFRCYLCGHKFEIGDTYRFVYGGHRHHINIMVCEPCDGTNDEVLDRWEELIREIEHPKFWRLRK